MKKIILSTVLIAGASIAMISCNGNYDANPDVDNSNITNPLNPPKPYEGPGANTNFDWSGTDPMSASVGGQNWVADIAVFTEQSAGGTSFYIFGTKQDDTITSTISINLPTDISAGNIYDMNPDNSNYSASYSGNIANASETYASNFVGGRVKILEIDATHIKGLFYFTGKSAISGQSKDITYGYFNAPKL